MFIQLILFTVALSIDALGIGISYGIRKISLHPISVMIISAISLIFSTLSLFLGNIISSIISESSITYISITLLFLMGVYIIISSIKKKTTSLKIKKNKKENFIISFILKYLNISINTIKNPESCDLNKSLKIEPKEALYLGTALSIDSISVGFAVYSLNKHAFLFPIFTMVFQLLFLISGIFFGKTLNYKNSNENFWSVLSGFILISISIIRLITIP